MTQHIYDTAIIGGGPAGYSAALYCARAGLDTVVLEKISAGGQMALTDVIDNYPGFDEGIDGFTLGMKMQQGAERFGAVTEYSAVTKVSLSGDIKRIETSGGELLCRTVIIATGADPKKINLEKEDLFLGKGIHYCAHCDGRFYKDKTVAVVGGGNSAVSDALYLSHLAKKVYLIHRRDTLRATKLYHEPLKKAPNVEFVFNSTVCALKGEERLSGISVENKAGALDTEIICDALFVSIGRRPVSELFIGQLDIDDYGYIIADETTKTNIDGVFAAGDIRTKALRQVVTAAADGATAAHFAEDFLATKQNL